MKLQSNIFISESLDPAYNLAFEEWLVSNIDDDTMIMFLWQNDKTVVIGRNQNPWKECQLKLMDEEKIKLVRRLSGGGAVYHDIGNLNYTFIAHKKNYNKDRQISVVLNALKSIGVEAEFTERNDLLINKKKFSGNAFLNHKDIRLQHGTLLINTDIDALEKYLYVSCDGITSKGVDSIRSNVINLNEINSSLNVSKMIDLLISSCNLEYDNKIVSYYNEESIKVVASYKKYIQREWNYYETPSFSMCVENRFDWGLLSIEFLIRNGKIKDCSFNTDSLFNKEFEKLCTLLKDVNFEGSMVAERCDFMNIDLKIKDEIRKLLISKI